MSKKVKLFKSKERRTRNEVSTFLKDLAAKIDEGQVLLRQGNQETNLELPDNVKFEVEADQKQKKHKGLKYSLEVEIEWYEGDKVNRGDGKLELG